ncbi:DUF305 domain-containing protein [Knoellia sp. DB2414S]|uniref:DUF305 domain-containing protein n=1 Tax=Knoellia koreensis TaxID=2730921 RepID=A0A849HCV1_9MICO|nr:DUF305 domain-containing protein [Knoellia sp. DB2414S]
MLAIGLVAVAALLVAGLVGWLLAGRDVPSGGSAEAGFARDMQAHHAQAVEMAFIIRDKTDDPTLRAVAYDIATSQQQQIGQMYGWLVQWGLPQTGSQQPMAWMTGHDLSGMSSHGSTSTSPTTVASTGTSTGTSTGGPSGSSSASGMPGMAGMGGDGSSGAMARMGMATPQQLATLRAATGVEAERQFLTLMIRHHQGGIEMAKAVLARTNRAEVRTLAQAIVTAQAAEITQMQQLLDARAK